MAYNLITVTEYKAYAGIKSTNYDAEISALIPRVTQFVKNYCGRTFVDYFAGPDDLPKVEIFSGGFNTILPTETPIVSITKFEGSVNYGKTYTLLTQYVDWVQDGDKIVSLAPKGFDKYINGYKLTYFGGWDDVPPDLALAVMDLVTYYRKSDMSVHSNSAPGTNKTQIEYITSSQLPAHIRRVLDQYRTDYT
jgi:hypothetical protein